MALSTNEKNYLTHYIHYPIGLEKGCIACHSKVEFVYVSSGHKYKDFSGYHKDIIRLYRCTNPFCSLHKHAFNPSPIDVLPYKRYSLGIWKWIAQESKIMKQSTIQIRNRIETVFGINIAENTIRDAIKEIDVFLSNKIDDETRKILKNQKKILIAMDGQKPDDEGNALWLFVDLISNRVLKVVILKSADSDTLHNLIEEILADFDVELIGGVSDKQNSITTMHKKYYSSIPWQYCHFHFLQNVWNHIEIKDGNLHKKLSNLVKGLYIMSASKSSKVYFEGLGKMSVRDVFHELELQLRAMIKARTKKFDHLRGIEIFERISALVSEMESALKDEDGTRRITKIMKNTLNLLKRGLKENKEQYEICVSLNAQFQVIRTNLGDEGLAKEEKMDKLDSNFDIIWMKMKGLNNKFEIDQLRSFLPQKDTEKSAILQEWVRLYHSYRLGLFAYYEFPVKAKTNSPMEQAFGQEKSGIIKQMGRKKVGGQIRIQGENRLKQIYAGKKEVKEIIDSLGPDYNIEELKEGLQKLADQTMQETMLWRNRVFQNDGLMKVLEKGKKT
ncbi:MAG: hypothetical protein ACTSRK_00925 [Promethearchaeota archaeon]